MPDLRITQVDPKKLNPAIYNPRRMSDADRAALRRSLEEFGLIDPIIVRTEGAEVIGGHQRLDVALEMGLPRVPVVYLEISATRAKALNIALNKIGGDWDQDKLSALLRELAEDGELDLTITGFSLEEIDLRLDAGNFLDAAAGASTQGPFPHHAGAGDDPARDRVTLTLMLLPEERDLVLSAAQTAVEGETAQGIVAICREYLASKEEASPTRSRPGRSKRRA